MALFMKKRDFTIPEQGVDEVVKVNLGGVDQTILIQAADPTKPVLLFVHGGPGMPVPGVVSRGQDYNVAVTTKELVKHFVVVFWDQRGTGKSYHKDIRPDSMRVGQFVNDCSELVDHLRNRFSQDKIFLAAHSWGTTIGLSIAARYPEKLHAYIGISQIMCWTLNDCLGYDWVKQKAIQADDRKTLVTLERLGRPPYVNSVKHWKDFRRPLMKYKSMAYLTEEGDYKGMADSFKIFLQSSEYALKDIFRSFYHSYKLIFTQALIEDLAVNDFRSYDKVETPVYFLHGRQDVHVNGKPVQDFYEELEAPMGKGLVWFEKSSHIFHPEDAKEIERFLIEKASPLQKEPHTFVKGVVN